MVFTRFVEVGRVCLINYGPETGKLCTIINVIDNNRALVDGPAPITGVKRQVINFKRLSLTDLKVDVGIHATEKSLKKAFAEANIMEEFAKTSEARLMERRKKRAAMNDFDRFKVMVAKKQKNRAIKKKLAELRK